MLLRFLLVLLQSVDVLLMMFTINIFIRWLHFLAC